MLLKYFFVLVLFVAGCDTYVEDQRTADFQPMYFQETETVDEKPDFGSIYQQDKGIEHNLYPSEVPEYLEELILVSSQNLP